MRQIVVIGPESTGKSTLCDQLAQHYKTAWCPEFAREYLKEKGGKYSFEDLLNIAHGQLELEDTMLTQAKNNFYFIDTDMYVMKVWCEFVFEKCHRFILDQIVERKYDHYFLCNTDLPWQPDELREYPDLHTRQQLFHIYKDIMINQDVPWTLISGHYDDRLSTAIKAVDAMLKD